MKLKSCLRKTQLRFGVISNTQPTLVCMFAHQHPTRKKVSQLIVNSYNKIFIQRRFIKYLSDNKFSENFCILVAFTNKMEILYLKYLFFSFFKKNCQLFNTKLGQISSPLTHF